MSDGSAFSMGFANAYKMMMDAEEKKKEQQAYKSYFDMQAQDAQAKIQPITDAATRANENSFSADVKRDASQMTTDIAANNPYLMQRVAGGKSPETWNGATPVNATPSPIGTVTPETEKTWATLNNNNAQQADNQAAQTQAMLQQAQQRYGTEMFGKLGALVEKGMDPRMAMKIADNHIAKAEAAALKEQQNQAYKGAMELMKQGRVDEAKMIIAEHLSPDAQGRMLASVGQGAGIQTTVQLDNGNIGYMDKAGKVVDTGNKFYRAPEKPTNVITFSGQTFKDDNGREYQLDSRGQRHYAPNPATTKDTSLKELNDEEGRTIQYLNSQKPNQLYNPKEYAAWQAKVAAAQTGFANRRAAIGQTKTQGASNGGIDLGNLTSEQYAEAQKLKSLGLSKEQIAKELQSKGEKFH